MRAGWGIALLWCCVACADAHTPSGSGGDAGSGGTGGEGASGGSGSGGSAGIDPDAALTDADGNRDAMVDLPLCPWAEPRVECAPSPHLELESLLSASMFGPDARFIAADDDVVLVARDTDVDLLVSVRLDFSGEILIGEPSPLPAGMRAIDVQSSSSATFVLACDDDEQCHLLVGSYGAQGLNVIPQATFLRERAPRGLVSGLYVGPLGVFDVLYPCVYGQRLMCFDGERWHDEIEGPPLVAAALAQPQVALTADGDVLMRRDSDDAWVEIEDLHIATPRWIDDAGRRGVAMQLDASTWAWIDADGQVSRCNAGAAYTTLRTVASRITIGVQASGEAFNYYDWWPEGDSCNSHQLATRGVDISDVIDFAASSCGIAVNTRLLTADTLVGTNACAID